MAMSKMRMMSLMKRGIRNYITERPLCVSFEITHCCNARCKHCHLGGVVDEQKATPQELGEICRKLNPLVAQISGGEPLLRKDLEQIVQAFRVPNRAPYIDITTNGVLLTKERYLGLRQAGVDEFGISMDYPDERHDEFRGVPGLFNRIESLIKELPTENRNAISLICVIQRDNFRDLIRMAELAADWRIKVNFSAYTWMRTDDKSYMLSHDELEEFKTITQKLLKFRKKHKNIFTSDYVFRKMSDFFDKNSMPNCRTGVRFFNVNPDGTFAPCGLIRTHYNSQEELRQGFSNSNNCTACYTSIRGNTEKPIYYLIRDNMNLPRNIL